MLKVMCTSEWMGQRIPWVPPSQVKMSHSPAVVDIGIETMLDGHTDGVVNDDLSWVG